MAETVSISKQASLYSTFSFHQEQLDCYFVYDWIYFPLYMTGAAFFNKQLKCEFSDPHKIFSFCIQLQCWLYLRVLIMHDCHGRWFLRPIFCRYSNAWSACFCWSLSKQKSLQRKKIRPSMLEISFKNPSHHSL